MARILHFFLIGAVSAKPTLRVKQDGSFKLALFCDMHFGEKVENDVASVAFEKTMIKLESPDLVVIDGDGSSNYAAPGSCQNATAECMEWFESNWRNFTAPLEAAGVPYAYTLGNHDRIPSAASSKDKPGDESHYAVSDHYIMHKDEANPHAMSTDGPSNIHGASNYVLPILGKDGKPAAYVWLLDSNDNNCEGVTGWGCVYPDQVKWFQDMSKQLIAKDGQVVPGVMFHHIPMDEALTAWNDDTIEVNGSKQEGICCGSKNTGLFQAMKDIGNIWGVFFGHDHNNDYIALYEGIRIGYGRKSGHGGYGGAVANRPGSRVIQLTEKPDGSVSWETWIREEAGGKIGQSKATRKPDGPKCCGMADTQQSTARWNYGSDMVAAAQACRAFDDSNACRVASGLGAEGIRQVVV